MTFRSLPSAEVYFFLAADNLLAFSFFLLPSSLNLLLSVWACVHCPVFSVPLFCSSSQPLHAIQLLLMSSYMLLSYVELALALRGNGQNGRFVL